MPPFPYIHIAKPWWLVVCEIGFIERSDCMFLLGIYDFVVIGKAKGEFLFFKEHICSGKNNIRVPHWLFIFGKLNFSV